MLPVESRRGLAAGTHELEWDGRDASGRAAPGGVYFHVLAAEGRSETVRITLVR